MADFEVFSLLEIKVSDLRQKENITNEKKSVLLEELLQGV